MKQCFFSTLSALVGNEAPNVLPTHAVSTMLEMPNGGGPDSENEDDHAAERGGERGEARASWVSSHKRRTAAEAEAEAEAEAVMHLVECWETRGKMEEDERERERERS